MKTGAAHLLDEFTAVTLSTAAIDIMRAEKEATLAVMAARDIDGPPCYDGELCTYAAIGPLERVASLIARGANVNATDSWVCRLQYVLLCTQYAETFFAGK